MKVTKFRISDYTISNGPTGFEETVTYLVEGVSGNTEQRGYHAMHAEGIPRRGDFHPFLNGVRCVEVSARPEADDNSIFSVTASWKLPSPEEKPPEGDNVDQGVISVGSTTTSKETNHDNEGQLMQIFAMVRDPSKQAKPLYKGGPLSYQYIGQLQTGTVQIEVGQAVMTLSRKEAQAPLAKSLKFTGSVNAASIWGLSARTLLCRRIEGRSDDGGATYIVDYEFEYNPETWDAFITGTEPETGGPLDPDAILELGGAKAASLRFEVYPKNDFSQLGLDFPAIQGG